MYRFLYNYFGIIVYSRERHMILMLQSEIHCTFVDINTCVYIHKRIILHV